MFMPSCIIHTIVHTLSYAMPQEPTLTAIIEAQFVKSTGTFVEVSTELVADHQVAVPMTDGASIIEKDQGGGSNSCQEVVDVSEIVVWCLLYGG